MEKRTTIYINNKAFRNQTKTGRIYTDEEKINKRIIVYGDDDHDAGRMFGRRLRQRTGRRL